MIRRRVSRQTYQHPSGKPELTLCGSCQESQHPSQTLPPQRRMSYRTVVSVPASPRRAQNGQPGQPSESLLDIPVSVVPVPAGAQPVPGSDPEQKYEAVGVGSYGCVLATPPPCEPPEHVVVPSNTPVVSKVFLDPPDAYGSPGSVEARKELSETQRIEQLLDPEHKFIPRVFGSCHVSPASLPQIEGCPPRRLSADKERVQIILENGGMNWGDIKYWNSEMVLRGLYTVASGLQQFESKGVIHNDIKPANLLYSDVTGLFRIIDFGLTLSYEDAWVSDLMDADYEFWPPETPIIAYLRDTFVLRIQPLPAAGAVWTPALVDHLVGLGLARRKAAVGGSAGRAGPDFHAVWKAQVEQTVRQIQTAVPNLLPNYAGPALKAYFMSTLNKHDIYGLGVTILYLIADRAVRYDDITPKADIEALALGMAEATPDLRLSLPQLIERVQALLLRRIPVAAAG